MGVKKVEAAIATLVVVIPLFIPAMTVFPVRAMPGHDSHGNVAATRSSMLSASRIDIGVGAVRGSDILAAGKQRPKPPGSRGGQRLAQTDLGCFETARGRYFAERPDHGGSAKVSKVRVTARPGAARHGGRPLLGSRSASPVRLAGVSGKLLNPTRAVAFACLGEVPFENVAALGEGVVNTPHTLWEERRISLDALRGRS